VESILAVAGHQAHTHTWPFLVCTSVHLNNILVPSALVAIWNSITGAKQANMSLMRRQRWSPLRQIKGNGFFNRWKNITLSSHILSFLS
jgi:hypothetical protein